MKRILHVAAFAALVSVGALASGFTSPIVSTTQQKQQASQADYNEGYYGGKLETEQNKCIDGAYFESNYQTNRQRVTNYLNTATSQAQVDYYQGYLDGMEEGYVTPVQCSSSGGSGTGSGGSGTPCNDGPCPVDFPELP